MIQETVHVGFEDIEIFSKPDHIRSDDPVAGGRLVGKDVGYWEHLAAERDGGIERILLPHSDVI